MIDWQTLSILQTSKSNYLEASDVLFAHSHFRISADWFSQSCDLGVTDKRMSNVTLEICYSEMSLLGSELPQPDVSVFDLPGGELVFHRFASLCGTEKALRRFTVCVVIPDYVVLNTEGGELEHLEKVGQRLARFSGIREIRVALVYCLDERFWWPSEEPRLSAIPLLKHLKPLSGSYTKETYTDLGRLHVQRFIFRDITPSQERRLITGLDTNTTIDCKEGPSSAIEIKKSKMDYWLCTLQSVKARVLHKKVLKSA